MNARIGARRTVLSLAAAVMLMGAKGNGCGGTVTDGGSTSGTGGGSTCEDGEVFDGQDCVPPDPGPICPDGSPGVVVCADPMGNPDPATDACWIECPSDPGCPPGYHEEWDCPPSCDGQMDGQCTMFCEPDTDPTECPPGSHYEEGCDMEVCWAGCVDDGTVCPPDSIPETICDEMGCYDVCTPIDPNQCPPGTVLTTTCDQMGCYDVCTPVDPSECPPDTVAQQVCDPMGCYVTCVPVDPTEPPPECPPGTVETTQCDASMNCTKVCIPL
ncbi:MAG TPA: hypothetical protein VL400_20145 [Polyangiaceae bacterium]|nr:hypothetical protein [Polyangiaceae bacterium]